MGHDFRYFCQVETRRLTWLIATIFAMVVLVQYLELPYGHIVSSLFNKRNDLIDVVSNREAVIAQGPIVFDQEGDPEDESPSKDFVESVKNYTVGKYDYSQYGVAPKLSMPTPMESLGGSDATDDTSPSPAAAPTSFFLNYNAPTRLYTSSLPPTDGTSPSPEAEPTSVSLNLTSPTSLYTSSPPKSHDSSLPAAPPKKKRHGKQSTEVVSISEMNKLFLKSRDSYHAMKPLWSAAVDQRAIECQITNFECKRCKGSKSLRSHLSKCLYVYKVTLYVPNLHTHRNMIEFLKKKKEIEFLKKYLDMIVVKYPFWNRTGGADHFLVACHDWAPAETREYLATCIRAMCNDDINEGFTFGKDVALPETYIKNPQNLLRDVGGKPPSNRPILAFFAGSMHVYLRPILLQQWQNKDPDIKIFAKMPKIKGKMNYVQHMKSSMYYICAKGYEVNSPRVVEAIFYERVQVIISDNFVTPFFETLDWESFAVFILEKDIHNLKKFLLSISKKRYFEMQRRVKKVKQTRQDRP